MIVRGLVWLKSLGLKSATLLSEAKTLLTTNKETAYIS